MNQVSSSTPPEPTIRVNVDVANPGQFFACCGLLELADRLWQGAEGWFDADNGEFCLTPTFDADNNNDLLTAIKQCPLTNVMQTKELNRLQALKDTPTKDQSTGEKVEKKRLEKLWRESPLMLNKFQLRLDWFLDSRAGGSRFKTWAGQQSVIDIAQSMKLALDEGHYDDIPPCDWIDSPCGSGVTFNFDAAASVQSSALDVGFVLDPLQMQSASRPLLEFMAFVGLQRFRPTSDTRNNAYTYTLWTSPLGPSVAAAHINGMIALESDYKFCFPLLYRTKYLKSFLPAQLVQS